MVSLRRTHGILREERKPLLVAFKISVMVLIAVIALSCIIGVIVFVGIHGFAL